MALLFSNTSDVVDCGAYGFLGLNPMTVCAWIYPTTTGGGTFGRIVHQTATVDSFFCLDGTTVANGLRLGLGTSGSSGTGISVANTIIMSAWNFVAGQWQYPTTPTIKLFKGSPTSLISEVSYNTQQNYTGSTYTPTGNLKIGKRDGTDRTFVGTISHVYIFSAFLTLAELVSIQYGIIPAHLYSDLKGFWSLWGVVSPEPDLSGKLNNGTVTGATKANGPPVGVYGPK